MISLVWYEDALMIWRWSQNKVNLKTEKEITLENEGDLKTEDNLKNEDDLKNEDKLKNKMTSKMTTTSTLVMLVFLLDHNRQPWIYRSTDVQFQRNLNFPTEHDDRPFLVVFGPDISLPQNVLYSNCLWVKYFGSFQFWNLKFLWNQIFTWILKIVTQNYCDMIYFLNQNLFTQDV